MFTIFRLSMNACRECLREPVYYLMLLAALLILGVIHVEFIVNGIFYIWNIAKPLIVGAALAYILEIIIKRLERIMFPRSKNKWIIR